MKFFNLLVVFTLFLLNSCGNGSEENSFEKTMEEARRVSIQNNHEYSPEKIDSATSKEWKEIVEKIYTKNTASK